MKTMQEMVRDDLNKYLRVGYSIDSAAKQVKSLRRGWDRYVDQVVGQIKSAD